MKKLLIVLLALVVLIGGGWFALTTIMIDTEDMATELTAALESATGREVQVSQTADVTLFPLPEVRYEGLQIGNIEGASSQHFVAASSVVLKLDLGRLVTGDAQPAEVVLNGASIDLEVMPGGERNWQFEGNTSTFHQYFVDSPVTLNDSVLRYVNVGTGIRAQLDDLNGVLRYEDNGNVVSFNGNINLHGQNSQVMARMNSVDLTADESADVPFQLALEHRGATFTAQGRLSSANQEPQFIGQLKVDAPDLWRVIALLAGGNQPAAAAEVAGASVAAEGNVELSLRHIKFEDLTLTAQGDGNPMLDGRLNMEYRFGDEPELRIRSAFKTLDADYLAENYFNSGLLDPVLQARQEKLEESDIIVSNDEDTRSDSPFSQLLDKLTGEIDVTIDNLAYNGQVITDIHLGAQMHHALITVEEGRASLPGDAKMVFSGMVRDKGKGPVYDGKFELQGRQVEQFLALFTPQGAPVPSMNLGRFGLRTNLSLSEKQMRFSEFQAVVADTRMAGSLIFLLEDRIKLESYLRIANINLDKIAKAAHFMMPEAGEVKTNAGGETPDELFDVQYINTRFSWLSAVGIDLDSDFYLQDFVLWDRKGELAKFKLDVGVGKAYVRNLQANYNGAAVTGTYGLEVDPNANPLFVVDGGISELNMVDIFPDLARVRNEAEWQEYLDEQLDLIDLQTHRADIKLKIGALAVRNYTFENVDTIMLLENNVLSIDQFDCNLWDGEVNARLKIQAGTIPSLSTSFRAQGASLNRLSESSALLKHAAGVTGFSGQLATSGVSLRSWYNNVQGELRVKGRDISVQGFGMKQLSLAVPVARTVNDVERAATIATNGGLTLMSSLTGIINIAEGKATIPKMLFTSPEAKGTISGTVNLIEEFIDLDMVFYLLNTVERGENPPMLTLHLQGDIDNVKKDIETRELKNYVAQKAAQRALGRSQ